VKLKAQSPWMELAAFPDNNVTTRVTFWRSENSSSTLGEVVADFAERHAVRLAAIMKGRFLCLENPTHGMQTVKDVSSGKVILSCGCAREVEA